MMGSIKNNTSLTHAALTGVQNGLQGLQKNASEIASKSNLQDENEKPLITSIVELKANIQQVEASAKALQVSDEIVGTLLDITV